MNKAFCDDKKLLVCDFENPAEFAIVSKELMQQLTAWVEECNSSRGICAINGHGKDWKVYRLDSPFATDHLDDVSRCRDLFPGLCRFSRCGLRAGGNEGRLAERGLQLGNSLWVRCGPCRPADLESVDGYFGQVWPNLLLLDRRSSEIFSK